MPQPHIIFISGASGAGKTALIEALQKKYTAIDAVKLFRFDTVSVPSEEEMIRDFGSPKEWQKAKTYQLIKKMVDEYPDKKIVIIEGQTELTFIEEACKLYGVKSFNILLLHSGNEARHKRLQHNRNQSELVNADMDNWAAYLFRQANEMGIKIIDNSDKLEACVDYVHNSDKLEACVDYIHALCVKEGGLVI